MNWLERGGIQFPNLAGMAGWSPVGVAAVGSAPAACSASMAAAAHPALRNPRFINKKRRLSGLLKKLAVHFENNNQYPSPPAQADTDAPLDLSITSKYTPPKQEPEQPGYICGACGQTFSVHDRLAKHVASRHRGKTPDAARAYECDVCKRRFARSDMLTRHARLHSGVKPYACSSCGQVFSRSDHLATHQRTHTGEKPYTCPSCPYAACRRDMITRHMRTHLRQAQPAA